MTQLVEERVRATGDDEATARAYLTSYDLCALWGDEETKQPVRKSISASGRPGGIIYYSGRLDAARECLASSHEAF